MTAETNPRTRQGTWVRVLVRGAVLTVALLGLVAFSVLLAKVTLTPSPASEDIVTSNLRPGRSLRQYAEDYTFLAALKQAGGNLLLGVPFGLLLPFFVRRRLRMIRTTLLTAAAMAVVELIQGALVTGRAFDIDDVILNTAGALLGYFVLGRRISHRYYTYTDDPGSSGPSAEKPEAEPVHAASLGARIRASRTRTAAKKSDRTGTAATKAGRTKAAATKAAGTKAAGTKAESAKTGQRTRPKPAAATPAKKHGSRTGRTDGPASAGRSATGSGSVRSLLGRIRGR